MFSLHRHASVLCAHSCLYSKHEPHQAFLVVVTEVVELAAEKKVTWDQLYAAMRSRSSVTWAVVALAQFQLVVWAAPDLAPRSEDRKRIRWFGLDQSFAALLVSIRSGGDQYILILQSVCSHRKPFHDLLN